MKIAGISSCLRRASYRWVCTLLVRLAVHLLVAYTAFATASATVPVTCWDAVSEFNDSVNPDAANPSGVWSYGWKEKVTGKFYVAVTPLKDLPNRAGWCNASGYPLLTHNIRPVAFVAGGPNPIVIQPGTLQLHPGLNGEYAVLRFQAPAAGTYRVSGRFYALDYNGGGTSTDVWVLANDKVKEAFSGEIDFKDGKTFASFSSHDFHLEKGETLDFEVGYGANKNMDFDSTGLMALIEKIK